MKKFLSFFICLFATTVYAQTEYDVEFYSETADAILLNVKVYNVKEKDANDEACRAAVETVLFEGVKESRTHKQPIIRNREQAMQKNGPYLHRFLDEGGYKTFIKESEGKTFTAHLESNGAFSLVEEPKWLFLKTELVRITDVEFRD